MSNVSPANKIMTIWVVTCVCSWFLTVIFAGLGYKFVAFLPIGLLMVGLGVILPVMTIWSGKQWFIKFVAFFNKNLLPVELIDFRCDRVYSMARLAEDGNLYAPTFWMNNIGQCRLLANGKVDNESESSYQYFWMPLQHRERVEFVLKNNLPDFSNIEKMHVSMRSHVLHQMRAQ